MHSAKSNPRKIPIELFWGKKPDISHLRVFGSTAYVHVPSPKSSELDAHTHHCVLSYDEHVKGYRYYKPTKRQVIISGDVQIVEANVTPLAPAHSNSQSNQVDSSSEFALLLSISFTKLLKLAPIQPGNPLFPTQAPMSPPTTWKSDMEESHEYEPTVPLSPNIAFQLPIPSTSPQRQPIITYQRRSTNPPPTDQAASPEPTVNSDLRRSHRTRQFNVRLHDFVTSA